MKRRPIHWQGFLTSLLLPGVGCFPYLSLGRSLPLVIGLAAVSLLYVRGCLSGGSEYTWAKAGFLTLVIGGALAAGFAGNRRFSNRTNAVHRRFAAAFLGLGIVHHPERNRNARVYWYGIFLFIAAVCWQMKSLGGFVVVLILLAAISSLDSMKRSPRLLFATAGSILKLAGASVAFLGVAYVLLQIHFARHATVYGSSMEPCIDDGDRILVSRIYYRLRDFEEGDMVFFYHAGLGYNLTKTVVGLPGDTLYAKGNEMLVIDRRDRRLEMPLRPHSSHQGAERFYREVRNGGYTLKEDEIFVVGCNLPLSKDSRNFGPISRDSVIGKVVGVFE